MSDHAVKIKGLPVLWTSPLLRLKIYLSCELRPIYETTSAWSCQRYPSWSRITFVSSIRTNVTVPDFNNYKPSSQGMFVVCIVFNFPSLLVIPRSWYCHASNSQRYIWQAPRYCSLQPGRRIQATVSCLYCCSLKISFKAFKLSVSGTKATLVNQLHSHLQCIQKTGTNNVHVADTSDSQTHAVSQGNGTSSSHVGDTSNSEQNGPAQGRGTSGLPTSDTSSSHRNPASNPQTTVTLTPVSSQNTIPQQFLNQLSNILQQATSTPTQIEDTDTMEDDRLSAASHPVQSSPPVVQPPMVRTSQVNPVSSQSRPLLVQPTLPPIPAKIKEKIARGEYIDFTTLLSKSMFGASEHQFWYAGAFPECKVTHNVLDYPSQLIWCIPWKNSYVGPPILFANNECCGLHSLWLFMGFWGWVSSPALNGATFPSQQTISPSQYPSLKLTPLDAAAR